MNKILVLLTWVVLAKSSPVEQTVIFNQDGSYRFNFDTGEDAGRIARHEERQADGTVIGRYSYEDPTGSVRVVNYRAGRQGFVATGDVGVAGAPPAQVPAEVPPVPEQPIPEEPDQNLQPGSGPDVASEKPVEEVKPEPPVADGHTEGPTKAETPAPPLPGGETIKVAIPDDAGRKREAGSPPVYYSDNYFPFSAPAFGKRRLDIPEEDDKDKIAPDEESDKKQDPVNPPSTYAYHFANPFVPQQYKPATVEEKKPVGTQEVNPVQYYFYAPVSPHFGHLPGFQPAQQPVMPNQVFSGPPKAWAYVPISAFPQMNSQPSPMNWVHIQPHAVNYIPAGQEKAPVPPPSEDKKSQIPVEVSTTEAPEQKPSVAEDGKVGPQGQVQPGFNRPTVHHYHFRGPSHTYGYYYQY